jgi:hypothetical protein
MFEFDKRREELTNEFGISVRLDKIIAEQIALGLDLENPDYFQKLVSVNHEFTSLYPLIQLLRKTHR